MVSDTKMQISFRQNGQSIMKYTCCVKTYKTRFTQLFFFHTFILSLLDKCDTTYHVKFNSNIGQTNNSEYKKIKKFLVSMNIIITVFKNLILLKKDFYSVKYKL